MNKKVNTVLFIIGATIANLVIMLGIFLTLIVLVGYIMPEDAAPGAISAVFMVIFLGSLVASYFIYQRLIALLSKKIDMEKYFHPIFRPRGKK
jgi:hypothetical protein